MRPERQQQQVLHDAALEMVRRAQRQEVLADDFPVYFDTNQHALVLNDGVYYCLDVSSESSLRPWASVTGLFEELDMHIRLVARVLFEPKSLRRDDAYLTEVLSPAMAAVQQEIDKIKVAIVGNSDLSVEEVNHKLNGERDRLYEFAELALKNTLVEFFCSRRLEYNPPALADLDASLRKTAAIQCHYFRTDKGAKQALWVSASLGTAHDKRLGVRHLALRRVERYNYRRTAEQGMDLGEIESGRVELRMPSLAITGKEMAHAIQDVADKLQHICQQMIGPRAFGDRHYLTYNLLTSLYQLDATSLVSNLASHAFMAMDEASNKQTWSAEVIVKAVHDYNRRRYVYVRQMHHSITEREQSRDYLAKLKGQLVRVHRRIWLFSLCKLGNDVAKKHVLYLRLCQDALVKQIDSQKMMHERFKKSAMQHVECCQRADRLPIVLLQNIPVNWHSSPLSLKAAEASPLIVELSLMVTMTLVCTLCDLVDRMRSNISLSVPEIARLQSLKEQLEVAYDSYLHSEKRPEWFYQYDHVAKVLTKLSQAPRLPAIGVMKIDELSYRTLDQLVVRSLYMVLMHQLHLGESGLKHGALIQSLSVYLQSASMYGCKSANERWTMVAGRVGCLFGMLASVDWSAQQQMLAEAMRDFCLDCERRRPDITLDNLQLALDTLYNDTALHHCSAMCEIDTGAAHGIQVNSGKYWNTNFAEQHLPWLHQSNAKHHQAHKIAARIHALCQSLHSDIANNQAAVTAKLS